MNERRRRIFFVIFLALLAFGLSFINNTIPQIAVAPEVKDVLGTTNQTLHSASEALDQLEVKGRAPKTGYKRAQFGDGWEKLVGCDTRNYILKRDLTDIVTRSATDCTVVSGVLNDPYTGKVINFVRGADTSDDVQIDHVVALSDAWQKGAQGLSMDERVLLANDGLNLLAVDGKTNQAKSDSDSASWLPPNKPHRCQYVARQIAVKQKYKLWVTASEKDAINRVLSDCPDQKLPVVS